MGAGQEIPAAQTVQETMEHAVGLVSGDAMGNAAAAAAIAAAGDADLLRILAPYDDPVQSRVLTEIADEYAAMPGNPPVEISFISRNDFKKEICISLEQNRLADLVVCDNSVMPALIDLHVLRDMSDYVNETHQLFQYSHVQWNNTRSDGKYYGIPFTNDPYVLIWNQDLFSQRGAKAPKDWEELKATAKQIQKVGTFALGIGARQPEEVTALFMQLLYSTGDTIREINGEGGMKVLELFQYMKANKMLSVQCINWNQSDLTGRFLDGEVSMMINTLSSLSVLKEADPGFAVGVGPVPYDLKENYMFHGKNIGISVTADAPAAMRFLDHVTQKSVVERIAAETESIPVQLDVPYALSTDGFSIGADFVEKQRGQGIAKSSLNSWFDVSATISEGLYRLIGEKDPPVQEIADAMQEQVRVAIIDN